MKELGLLSIEIETLCVSRFWHKNRVENFGCVKFNTLFSHSFLSSISFSYVLSLILSFFTFLETESHYIAPASKL